MNKSSDGLAAAVFLAIWGVYFLAVPKYLELDGWIAWTCYILGFILLLFGTMGTCLEVFK